VRRVLFVRAYPREIQEIVFDAHARAFGFFRGGCTRGIYDNVKTAVETLFVARRAALTTAQHRDHSGRVIPEMRPHSASNAS
jgi:transposase